MTYPQWATPQRRNQLVQLFDKCGGLCVYGHRPCAVPEHHYEWFISGEDVVTDVQELIEEPVPYVGSDSGFVIRKRPVAVLRKIHLPGVIDEWKAEDRDRDWVAWRRERRLLHQMPDNKGWGRKFDPVAREKYLNDQPAYQLEGLGVSGLTFTRIAKVRIASTNVRLFVDVANTKLSKKQRRRLAGLTVKPTGLSKRQRRHLRRFGILPESERIEQACEAAVTHYWNKLT